MSWASTRACLHIARRDARRSPGRSLLVLAMIALPVLGMTGADVLYRSAQLDPRETATRLLGAADVAISDASSGGGPITQSVDGSSVSSFAEASPQGAPSGPSSPRPGIAELGRLIPGVRHAVLEHLTAATVLTSAGERTVQWDEVDYADPLLAGRYEQIRGRAPRDRSEVALTTAEGYALAARVGSLLRLPDGTTRRVVGIVRYPDALDARTVLGLEGSAPSGAPTSGDVTAPPDKLYLQTSAPVTWQQVLGLNHQGVLAVSREVLLNPPPSSQVPGYDSAYARTVRLALAGVVLLVVGLSTLEVVLLAGAAFAVGARRQRRALAVVAVAGGDASDLRRIVRAGGLVLGAVGATTGVALGLLAAGLARGPFEGAQHKLVGHFDVHVLDVVAIWLVGAATGVLAAMIPARSAGRADVVAVLAGRSGVRATRARVPVFAVVVVVVGLVCAVVGSRSSSGFTAAKWILAGSVLCQLGALIGTSAIVGLAGRAARRLPLAGRLALRDAARHRGRTAPAVGAIMAAVAGSTALAVYVVSDADHTRRTYVPTSRPGTVVAQLAHIAPDAQWERVRRELSAALPTRSSVVLRTAGCNPAGGLCNDFISVQTPPPPCPAGQSCGSSQLAAGPVVGDVPVLRALTGERDAELEAALVSGHAVVFARGGAPHGMATFERSDDQGNVRSVRLPAVEAAAVPGVLALVPPPLATRLGGSSPVAVFVDTRRAPTAAEEDAARAALTRVAGDSYLNVERGVTPRYAGVLIALLIGTTIITVGASAVATGLAAADGRADLATLGAVGAAPRTRRLLAGTQALVVAALGTTLGVAVGFVPAVAYIHGLPGYAVSVPWTRLAVLVLAVPALAALLAAAVTRSRLPMIQRIG